MTTKSADTEKAQRYAGALEHLKGYIDLVLEAFHTGTGLVNSAPEPITIDIARRMIWAELTRVFGSLDTANWSRAYLWARLQTPEVDGIAKIVAALDGAPGAAGVSFRAYGPRNEGDPTVVYACIYLAKTVEEVPAAPLAAARSVLNHLWRQGITTRDVSLGTRA